MEETQARNPVKKFISVFKYSAVAVRIVWNTSPSLTIVMALTTLVAGILPASIASVGGMFVDAVSSAFQASALDNETARDNVLRFVLIEAG
ncbi:MAG: ATP-binding cassette subfamily B protein, partial [Pseudohongiellaceae bacterium]